MENRISPRENQIGDELRLELELLREEGFRNELFFQITGSKFYLVKNTEVIGGNQIKFGRIDEIVEKAIKNGKYTDKDGIEHQVPTDPNEKRKLAQAYYKRMIPLFSMMNLE